MEIDAVMTHTLVNSQSQKNNEKLFVSVVVPGFNEAQIVENNLIRICEYMESLEDKYRWEIIFVNDGSTDGTGELADALAARRENLYVLHHMYNFRLGQALRFAFHKAQGDYVVVLDLDLSYSLDHIAQMLDRIKETKAKIVVASPYMKGGKVSNVPWPRKFLSICANRFLSFFARDRYSEKLHTITGMVRTYDREFLSRLNLKAMDVDINPEIIYKAMVLRARIVEMPAHLNWGSHKVKSDKRQSSIRILRSTILSLMSGFMFRPFIFFIIPGFGLMLLALYPIIWALIHTFSYYKSIAHVDASFDYRISQAFAAAFDQSPHAFIVGGIALMVAIQLISLGFLAYQSKRHFEELFHLGSNIYHDSRDIKR
jgi:glycosyltransferase involved in cell wall biosynthesis